MCVRHLAGGGRSAPRLIDGGPPKHRDHAPALLPSSSFSFQASWPSTSKLSSCPPSSPCVGECIVGVRAASGRRWAVPARARASLCCCAARVCVVLCSCLVCWRNKAGGLRARLRSSTSRAAGRGRVRGGRRRGRRRWRCLRSLPSGKASSRFASLATLLSLRRPTS